VNIEQEGDGALDLHVDAPFIAYLQACGVLVRLTPKEQDQIVHKV
jgi:hypothetical protein